MSKLRRITRYTSICTPATTPLTIEISSMFIIRESCFFRPKNVHNAALKCAVTSHKKCWKVWPFAKARETLSVTKTPTQKKQTVGCSSSGMGSSYKLEFFCILFLQLSEYQTKGEKIWEGTFAGTAAFIQQGQHCTHPPSKRRWEFESICETKDTEIKETTTWQQLCNNTFLFIYMCII